MKLFFFLCSYLAFFVMTVTHSEARDVGLGFEPEIGPETIDLSLNNLDQDDPSLIKILRDKYLIKPSKKELNLNNPMSSKTLNGQFGQPFELDEKHFRGKKKKGFFIEAGAIDGEDISNTLFFEVRHKWSGLLIEPNRIYFDLLQRKNRKAWTFGHCLSTKRHPEVVLFQG